MTIPITGVSNAFDCILLTVAWLTVRSRINRVTGQVAPGITYIRSYLAYFAIFNACMALPYLLLFGHESAFPKAMGWGYAVANIFLLVSLACLSRMAVKLAPRTARYDKFVIAAWVVLNAGMFILNIYYVALNNNPTFTDSTGVTTFHFPAFLGPILGTVSLIAYLPGVVLFAMNAFQQFGYQRLRSILLAVGMALIMVVGPLHAAAASWQIFVLADMLNIVSLALITAGVVYRLDTQKAPASPMAETPGRR